MDRSGGAARASACRTGLDMSELLHEYRKILLMPEIRDAGESSVDGWDDTLGDLYVLPACLSPHLEYNRQSSRPSHHLCLLHCSRHSSPAFRARLESAENRRKQAVLLVLDGRSPSLVRTSEIRSLQEPCHVVRLHCMAFLDLRVEYCPSGFRSSRNGSAIGASGKLYETGGNLRVFAERQIWMGLTAAILMLLQVAFHHPHLVLY